MISKSTPIFQTFITPTRNNIITMENDSHNEINVIENTDESDTIYTTTVHTSPTLLTTTPTNTNNNDNKQIIVKLNTPTALTCQNETNLIEVDNDGNFVQQQQSSISNTANIRKNNNIMRQLIKQHISR